MKKIGLIAIAFFVMGTQNVSAYDLKKNMFWLNSEFKDVQQGFMTSDPKKVLRSIKTFSGSAKEMLADKDAIRHMFPKGKEKQVTEATNAAKVIEVSVQVIIDEIENKEKHSELVRRENSQSAYIAIESACFRCHNIVRDQ